MLPVIFRSLIHPPQLPTSRPNIRKTGSASLIRKRPLLPARRDFLTILNGKLNRWKPDRMQSIESQLQKITELISLPEVYLKINRLMNDPTSNIGDFAKVINLDASLSAKLLKVVNSVYYGLSGEVSSISRAVSMVGIQQLHVMVLSISAVSAVSSLNFPRDIADLKAFWRSSLLTGNLARTLAHSLRLKRLESFFIIGLLHEIGHLVLYAHFPEQARAAMQLAREKDIPIHEAEQQAIGCHYGTIGANLMTQWHLPPDFAYLTRYQPTPELADEQQQAVALIHVAHAYAQQKFLLPQCDVNELIHPTAWKNAGLSAEDIEQSMAGALESSAELERIILH